MALVGICGSAWATNIEVTRTNASGPGSLAAAVYTANLLGGSNQITFAVAGTITLAADLVLVTNNLTIDGGGKVVLSGGGVAGLFRFAPGTTNRLMNLTLRDAWTGSGFGGAVSNASYLTVSNCVFLNNRSQPDSIDAGGAAIFNSGWLDVMRCQFSQNASASIYGLVQGYGGAVYNMGNATIRSSRFESNSAVSGGAIANAGTLLLESAPEQRTNLFLNSVAGRKAAGGAIWNSGSLEIRASIIQSNLAENWGGAIFSSGTLELNGVTLSGNTVRGFKGVDGYQGGGGGGGGAGLGGAVYISTSSCRMTNCTLSGNTAIGGTGGMGSTGYQPLGGGGGGPWPFSGKPAGFCAGGYGSDGDGGWYGGFGGGGGGTHGNIVPGSDFGGGLGGGGSIDDYWPAIPRYYYHGGGGGGGAGMGGGIFMTNGTVDLVNCTLAANVATGGAGGAEATAQAGSPGSGYGGGLYVLGGAMRPVNTWVAGNVADHWPEMAGPLASQGFNYFGDVTGATGFTVFDYVNESAEIKPLGDYGGGTLTHALAPGSLAIGGAMCALGPEVDQRGVVRGMGTCDVGAFQAAASTIVARAGDGGSISPAEEVVIDYGASQTFTAKPADGYEVWFWSVDGITVQRGGLTYLIDNVVINHEIIVTFQVGKPRIISEPAGGLVNAGETTRLEVAATGWPPLTYQWFFEGLPLLEATNGMLEITSAEVRHAGAYQVMVANQFGTVTSAVARLLVFDGVTPLILQHPESRNGGLGEPVIFNVTAIGAAPLGYQWQLNQENIPGATNAELRLPLAQWPHAGAYRVVVSNGFGSTTSQLAALSLTERHTSIHGWGSTSDGLLNIPSGLSNVVEITTGYSACLARTADGRVIGWGKEAATFPVGLTNIMQVAANNQHYFMALRDNGTVVDWGILSQSAPGNLTNVVQITAGAEHAVALRADGTVVAWGNNWEQQTQIPAGLSNVTQISAGNAHTLALKVDGTVTAWGSSSYSQNIVPTRLTNVIQVAAGQWNSLALCADGTVVAWGNNTTLPPTGQTSFMQICAGNYANLAIRSDGSVYGWGDPAYLLPFPPAGLSNVVRVSLGLRNAYALSLSPLSGQIPPPPALIMGPAHHTIISNEPACFVLGISGFGPMNCQWLFENDPLPYQTNTYLLLDHVNSAHAGAYRVVVSSPYGAVTNAVATLTVRNPNLPPTLPALAEAVVDELTLLTVTNTATDPNLPANHLAYALLAAPEGVAISPEGIITWTPAESQGPGSFSITTRVTDDGAPPLSATNSFVVTVKEINAAPVLDTVADQVLNPGQWASVTLVAADTDVPANLLTFSFVSGPPGAEVDAATGAFRWRASLASANTTNRIQIRATDTGEPPLSDTREFQIIVRSSEPVTLLPLGWTAEGFSIEITGPLGPDYILQGSIGLEGWINLLTNTPIQTPVRLIDTNGVPAGARFYRLRLIP